MKYKTPMNLLGRRQRGFTYLGLLFTVVILGIGLAATGTVWHVAQQRQKEQELLFIGHEFQTAIERYYLNNPSGLKRYPLRLEDLLRDPRRPEVQRYLRRIYPDPITASNEWGLIKAPDGGIMGIYSLSDQKPLKVARFRANSQPFDASEKYSDWRFIARPRTILVPVAKPGMTEIRS